MTARHIDERWAADVMDLTAKASKGMSYVLLCQDLFSRFLFARALRSKAEVGAAFARLLEEES